MSESTKNERPLADRVIEEKVRRRLIDAYVASLPNSDGGTTHITEKKQQEAGSVLVVTNMGERKLHAKGMIQRQKDRARVRGQTNAEFAATNKPFRAACSEAGLEPTARQASKWRAERGLARFHRPAALAVLNDRIRQTQQMIRDEQEKYSQADPVSEQARDASIEIKKLAEQIISFEERIRALKGA